VLKSNPSGGSEVKIIPSRATDCFSDGVLIKAKIKISQKIRFYFGSISIGVLDFRWGLLLRESKTLYADDSGRLFTVFFFSIVTAFDKI